DVPLGEPDRVALLAPDRDLVTDYRDDRRLPFFILDYQLEHRATCPRNKRYQSRLEENNRWADYLFTGRSACLASLMAAASCGSSSAPVVTSIVASVALFAPGLTTISSGV